MVKRLLGLKRLPDVSTISRSLGSADKISVEKVRGESRNLVIERLATEGLARVTLDFDGSVLSTGRQVCRYLVKDSGTSKSPKSTRQRESRYALTVLWSSRFRIAHAQQAARALLHHDAHNDSTAFRMRFLYIHILRAAVIIKPSILLKLHEALKKRKYRLLFSARKKGKPGPKGPSQELI